MENISPVEQLLLRSQRLPWALIGVALAILAGSILFATLQLRAKIQKQIAGRDGEVLDAVAFEHLAALAADMPEIEFLGPLTDPNNQLGVVLKTSRLKGVVATRLFDTNGNFTLAFPPNVREAALDPQSLQSLRELKPVSRFRRAVRASNLFLLDAKTLPDAERTLPLLEVNVPLHTGADRQLLGIAQFVIEGYSIAAEFSQLDRNLARQALAAFLVGGGILTLTILWAFRRLRGAHLLLAERTRSLMQANQALALAAKTSAVGAITSHLIHGLKNPLSGLQNLVASLASADADSPEADWQQAIVATRRMQGLITQVVNVLREEEGSAQFQITMPELAEIVVSKVHPLSLETGVRLATEVNGGAVLPNDTANLVVRASETRHFHCLFRRTQVSDRSQPPLTLDWFLSETAGSRSLHRLVGGNPESFALVRLGICFGFPCKKRLHRLAHPAQPPLAIHLVERRCVDKQVPPRDELTCDQRFVLLLVVLRRLVPLPFADLDHLCHLPACDDNILIRQWRWYRLNVFDGGFNGSSTILVLSPDLFQNLLAFGGGNQFQGPDRTGVYPEIVIVVHRAVAQEGPLSLGGGLEESADNTVSPTILEKLSLRRWNMIKEKQ